jgi:NAD(P)-dependent dehydrogenase (short-subunit alcohol dehydrogenase family)
VLRVAIETAVRHYGGLHVLHNNAGGSTPADNTVVEAPIEEFWRAIRLDLFGTFLGCRFGLPASSPRVEDQSSTWRSTSL